MFKRNGLGYFKIYINIKEQDENSWVQKGQVQGWVYVIKLGEIDIVNIYKREIMVKKQNVECRVNLK